MTKQNAKFELVLANDLSWMKIEEGKKRAVEQRPQREQLKDYYMVH